MITLYYVSTLPSHVLQTPYHNNALVHLVQPVGKLRHQPML